MTARQIVVIVAAVICWGIASCCSSASADSESTLNGGAAFDRTGTTMPNATSVLDLPAAAGEIISTDRSMGPNPLWGIPLELLSVTRDRPLFSSSRRPPSSAVVGPPVKAAAAVSAAPAPKPTLNLVGTVEGNSEGYAVFVDTETQNTVRLRIGEVEDGWILRSVSEREVILYRNHRTEVLRLPAITSAMARVSH